MMKGYVKFSRMSMKWIKFLLYAINFVFVLTGALIIFMTEKIHKMYHEFPYFLDFKYSSPAIVFIIAAIFVFIISFFGFYGTYKESTSMIMTCSIILSTVFILEFITLVTAYTLQDDVNYYLSKKMEDAMKHYYENPAAQYTIDNLQQNLKCCGYDRPDQLMKIVAYKSPSLDSLLALSGHDTFPDAVILTEVYPSSCFECGNSKCQAQLFTQGCHQTLADIVNDNTVSLITGVTIIIFVQVVSIMLACTLERMIHKHKMDRNMRMWQKRTTRQNIYVPFDKTNPTTTFHAVHI